VTESWRARTGDRIIFSAAAADGFFWCSTTEVSYTALLSVNTQRQSFLSACLLLLFLTFPLITLDSSHRCQGDPSQPALAVSSFALPLPPRAIYTANRQRPALQNRRQPGSGPTPTIRLRIHSTVIPHCPWALLLSHRSAFTWSLGLVEPRLRYGEGRP
jgi:hypothetical protein